MSTRYTKKDVERMFCRWLDATGLHESKDWKEAGYFLDRSNDPRCPGWTVRQIKEGESGEYTPFGTMRFSAKELYYMLYFAAMTTFETMKNKGITR